MYVLEIPPDNDYDDNMTTTTKHSNRNGNDSGNNK